MELPLRQIIFNDEDGFGVFAISQVSTPAIEENHIFFSSDKKIQFATNEEQRIVFAPVLIPNQKIYRNMNGIEFNIFVDAPTIERIAVSFVKNNRLNNVNLEHNEKLIDGVTMFQSFITNENTVPIVKGFEHLPVGTWFVGAKVKNDEVWQGIKEGKFNGWSIHALFNHAPIKMSDDDVKDILKAILCKI